MSRAIPVLIALAALASAQEFRGTILGRVTDSSGAVVAGAAIKVTNINTNASAGAASNQEGNFQVPFLLPGNYTVAVEHPGFKRVERSGVRVSVGTPVTLDFLLEIGAATEAVTVTATPPLLNTAGADIGQVVERAYVDKTTVTIRRNPMSLVHLTPGVTTDGWETSYTDNAQSQISISGGGGKRGGVEFLIDGQPATVPSSGGTLTFVPALDAVEEFKVHQTLFDASFGHSNGGAVSITTRGGTNQVHGATYFHKEWAALDANTWANNRLGLPRPPLSRYMWGIAASGPLELPKLYRGRNRTFFSTSLELDDRKTASTLQTRVPTPLERAGDFSQTLNRQGNAPLIVYDPATTVVTGNTARRQPFAGARIPSNRLDPTGAAVMQVFPAPNLNEPAQIGLRNYAAGGYYPVIQRQFMARIDHNISSANRLFGRVGYLTRDQNSLHRSLTPPGFFGNNHNLREFSSFSLDDTITLSPTFVGSIRYGVSRRAVKVRNGDGDAMDPGALKLPAAIVANQAVKGWPVFNMGENLMQIGGYRSFDANDLHSAVGTFTKLIGSHSLKFGVDYRVVRNNQVNSGASAAGNFTYNPTFTQSDPFSNQAVNASGTGMASLLLGIPASGSIGYNSPVSLQSQYIAGFLQEDWKVTRRLTLNFGLRYELETPYTERYNRSSAGFDQNAPLPIQPPGMNLRGGVLFAGVDGNSRRQARLDANNFGPRFGFAYSATANTVVRGGYGLFYAGQIYNATFLGDVGVFNAVTPYTGSIDNGATPFTTMANPFPSGLRGPIGSSAGLMAQAGDSLAFYDPGRLSPYNQQWQFSIQRQLPAQMLVEAAYIGMLTLKQLESFNLNERPDRYLALGAAENNRVSNPFLNVFPATSVLGQGATIVQSRLWPAYPQFTSLTVHGANTGKAIYHGLQLRVEKRMTHGLNVLWNYTHAKIMENYTTSLVNERHYRTISETDQPHLMKLAVVYEMPATPFRGAAGAKLLNGALGGWSVSAFWIAASGQPMSVSHVNGRPLRIRNAALSGPASSRLGDQRDASGRVLNPYFDTAAFQPLASQYMVTPEPPLLAELRGPATNRMNGALFKTFPIWERFRLEARIEVMDLTNTPQFDNPGTNMSQPATFGVVNGAAGARKMFGALRLTF